MTIYQLTDELLFPPPEHAEKEGLLAIGGDLSVHRLLLAYSKGIFPWYSDGDPILWWSPDPRLILLPENLKVSKSLQRIIKKEKFEVRFDTCFEEVLEQCSRTSRRGQNGTWITQEMKHAYLRLFEAGFAHSAEAFFNDELVGGLYGISLGKAFFGESMFSHMSDSSKVAFTSLVRKLEIQKYHFIDCQVTTRHLQSLGAHEISRTEFLERLQKAIKVDSAAGRWAAKENEQG